MTNNNFTCPHCGGQISVKRGRSNPWAKSPAPGQFQSVTAPTAGGVRPRGRGLLALLWFLSGRQIEPAVEPEPPVGRVVIPVRVEQQEGRAWVLHDFDDRISHEELLHVAEVILFKGDAWSRKNLTRRPHGLSQPKYHLVCDEFKQLNYLHVTRGNVSVLSLRGLAFLRSVSRSGGGTVTSNNKQQRQERCCLAH